MNSSLFIRHIYVFVYIVSFFTGLTSCRKEINQSSASSIRYFQGGIQDKVQSVIKTPDGGFLFIGYSLLNSNTDAFLLKVDARGMQQWYKTYGGDKLEYFKNAIATSDGGFMAVGASNTESFDTANAALMGYVVKTDANGNLLWEKRYGNKITRFMNLIERKNSGDFLITGFATINWPLICLVSIDANGNTLFNRTYTNGALANVPPLNIPDLYAMFSNAVALANDGTGNVLLGGTSSKSHFAWETQTLVTHILSVGSNGTPSNSFYRFNDFMNHTYLGLTAQLNFIRNYPVVAITGLNDGYFVATFTNDKNWNLCMQLLKTDKTNDITVPVWQKQYKGLGNALLYHFNDNEDGTYMLTGSTTTKDMDLAYPEGYKGIKIMTVKIDKQGNPLWTQYYGSENNSNIGMCTQPSVGGGYFMACYNSSDQVGFHRMYCLFLDKDGKILASKE